MKNNIKIWIFPFILLGFSSIVINSCKSSEEPVIQTGTVKDIDGNVYDTIAIGTQVWLVQNLKTTRYRNGMPIPNLTADTAWSRVNLINGAYCNYLNDDSNSNEFGRLYNWYAVNDTSKLAPLGWHIPSDSEWTVLQNYLIANGYNYKDTLAGNFIAKSLVAKSDWISAVNLGSIGNDLSLNNKSGFSALPAGYRYFYTGAFQGKNYYGCWWSSTQKTATTAIYRSLYNDGIGINNYYTSKLAGFSVRCIKD